jgi:trigger factor
VARAARDTDRVVIDYSGLIGGKPFDGSTGTDINVVIGSKQSMPELEEGLKGASAGETRTIPVPFPAEHPNKAVAGQTAELQVTIKRVEEQSLPTVDEEFVRAYGVEQGGVEALRAEVRKSMERELADVIRNRVRGQLLDALYRQNPVDVPRTLLEEQVQQLQIDTARRMGIRDASQLPARDPFVEPARRRVALGLLMTQIVQAEQIKLDRERVQARLTDLVAGYPEPQQEEARRAYLQNQDAMRQIESAAIEDQVVDWLLSKAAITDKTLTFKEITGFGQEQA